MNFSANGLIAVSQPKLDKIDAEVSMGGLAINRTRTNLLNLELVFSYRRGDLSLVAGADSILVSGDAGARPWSKRVFEWQGKQFVLMPESEMIGYTKGVGPV
jgi:hypothetical protein